VKALEAAGAVWAEILPARVVAEISKRTSLILVDGALPALHCVERRRDRRSSAGFRGFAREAEPAQIPIHESAGAHEAVSELRGSHAVAEGEEAYSNSAIQSARFASMIAVWPGLTTRGQRPISPVRLAWCRCQCVAGSR
jgi:hypothetical protein